MPRILVIADDLTGAAEIGGIATRYGLTTQLLRTPAPPPISIDCVVYDTDSRLLPTEAAAKKTAAFAQAARAGSFDLIYKKTDSVLRGEPFAEINVVAHRFGRSDVLFVPHNPSRNRCITGGRYHVAGVPLHQTEFARDPLHPATTDDALALLRDPTGTAKCVPPGSTIQGFILGQAGSVADVQTWAAAFDPTKQLAAGAADLFDAIVRRLRTGKSAPPAVSIKRPLLFVSGTASQGSAVLKTSLKEMDRLLAMPDEVFTLGVEAMPEIEAWAAAAEACLVRKGEAMLAIDRPSIGGIDKAELLQTALVATAQVILEKVAVKTVACEGGATAAALCDRLGWQQFVIEAEIAPGIVMLRSTPSAPRLIVKPGSYPWPRV